ncbi:hypothetical protein CFBP5877_11045 [Agrobacterium tumefaciens]|uniref:Uncharacterized protein n=1 Tax=Agrobacterium tumefaciens TaxID=358 RepID=A0AAE6EG92_AGRTU|nr:hypothetical protein CFBP5499_11515 [Agrobacterium tumefaciens]QCL80346.1 hypothetical protein CFBP5877_11045 [Agrobacterium tumefaciens]
MLRPVADDFPSLELQRPVWLHPVSLDRQPSVTHHEFVAERAADGGLGQFGSRLSAIGDAAGDGLHIGCGGGAAGERQNHHDRDCAHVFLLRLGRNHIMAVPAPHIPLA